MRGCGCSINLKSAYWDIFRSRTSLRYYANYRQLLIYHSVVAKLLAYHLKFQKNASSQSWPSVGPAERPQPAIQLCNSSKVLRVGRVSVAIRKLVHYSWYGPAGERPSWAGTNWKGSAGQGSAIIGRDRYSAERDFLCVYVFARPQVEQIAIKQCFHHHFMYTCLLRATFRTPRR
jgi:hypothetical protein